MHKGAEVIVDNLIVVPVKCDVIGKEPEILLVNEGNIDELKHSKILAALLFQKVLNSVGCRRRLEVTTSVV